MDTFQKQRILLVDDEPDILEFVGYNLKNEGFEVNTASNGKDAIKKAIQFKPHLIILDVMMPEMDGIETCNLLREIDELNTTIIAFLTARGEDYSQIAGFDAGADDYITKPIKPKVLISRVKALLKRHSELKLPSIDNKTHLIEIGNIIIDKEKYVVLKMGEELILPRKEFELLVLLVSKQDKVFTRDEIYNTIWGDSVIVGDRTIDVYISKLREKLGKNSIKTIKGIGYKFVI
ncbi:MAG: response regulator transcription factor [Bacteroidales bacterium]|nr:response regulator transcription factor [Bacteroidales bacterium]MDY0215859.1 response regulator transcription factor [Bacteroidales bacterium]